MSSSFIPFIRLKMERICDVEVPKLSTPADAAKFIQTFLSNPDKEHMVVLSLNNQMIPVAVEIVSIGTANMAFLSVKDIFKHAILSNATNILIAHNHPGGSLEPSDYDVKVTEKIKEAGKLLEIQMVDHIIVTEKGYASMKSLGCFSQK